MTSRLHPARARTTSHNPLSLFSIKDCGSSAKKMPWQHSLFLCLGFPYDRWRGEAQRSLSFFLLFQNQHNCYLFLPSSFAFVFLPLTSQWSIQKQPCECILLFGRERKVSMLRQQRLNTSGWIISFFQRILLNYHWLFFFFHTFQSTLTVSVLVTWLLNHQLFLSRVNQLQCSGHKPVSPTSRPAFLLFCTRLSSCQHYCFPRRLL